ncbi:MAG: paraquat-inducible protein A [Nitrospirota bacterium]
MDVFSGAEEIEDISMKQLALIIAILIVIASSVLCQQIIANSISNQENKNDYAELNHVKYGLFSVDEWKRQITVILAEEINELYLTRTSERELRKHVEVQLNALINNVDTRIRAENKGSVEGWFKQAFINVFISLEDIKKGIPEYADAVIREVMKSKTKGQIKVMLNKRIQNYLDRTFAMQDRSRVHGILARTVSEDMETARVNLDGAIAAGQALLIKETLVLIALSVILFSLSGLGTEPLAPSRYILLVLSLIILLTAGVTTPMIDMEAKISQMSFVLAGHPVHFENQVLYFQSKSILDVFRIMITHKDIQMKFVGVLLVMFSIVFPLLKLLSSLVYYYKYRHAREHPVITFFVLKSGKWSMADVMVIALFMTYIGFNGIISSQLGQLRNASEELVILTTNGTSLQPGYYLFLTYTLLALFLSGFLARTHRDDTRGG